ncbi:MAG: glutamate racemase [Myxococcota bacterium]
MSAVPRASSDTRPIGVFDSGLGGLTVASAIRRRLPDESIIYLGDTARVPYGTRSSRTVLRYAKTCARTFMGDDVKAFVVACNTVSAVALDTLRVELDVPVLGVVVPGAKAGLERSNVRRVGVLATPGTVASGAYGRAIASLDSRAEAVQRAAPLLVPLAEEGWLDGEVPERVVERYLASFEGAGIDALVLGCTHYPLFRDTIERVGRRMLHPSLAVADSAEALARTLASELESRARAAEPGSDATLQVRVTDLPDRFEEVAARFFGEALGEVTAIDLR